MHVRRMTVSPVGGWPWRVSDAAVELSQLLVLLVLATGLPHSVPRGAPLVKGTPLAWSPVSPAVGAALCGGAVTLRLLCLLIGCTIRHVLRPRAAVEGRVASRSAAGAH